MAGPKIGNLYEMVGIYAARLPRDEVVAAIVTASRRGLAQKRFDSATLRLGMEEVAGILADGGYTDADLAPIRDFLARLLMH
jgi:hypothetical protein